MPIQIRKIPSVAPAGPQKGRFIGATESVETNTKGGTYRKLTVSVQLEALDREGKPFVVTREYNLDGHGPSDFERDFSDSFGRALTPEEVEAFEPDILLKGKPVIVQIVRRPAGKKFIAEIEKFMQAEVPAEAPVSAPAQS